MVFSPIKKYSVELDKSSWIYVRIVKEVSPPVYEFNESIPNNFFFRK